MALLGATKLAEAMINAFNGGIVSLWSSYYFATQVYTECKIFPEKCWFMQIYDMVYRCSRR